MIDLQSMGLAYYTSIGDAKVTSTIILDALHFVGKAPIRWLGWWHLVSPP
jgi:hypothetical protein